MEFATKTFSPLTRNVQEVIDIMDREVRPAPVGSEDYPEAMYDGVYAGITETLTVFSTFIWIRFRIRS